MTPTTLFSSLILPPAGPLFLVLLGLVLLRQRPRAGYFFAGSGLLLGWLLATPWAGDNLLAALQRHPPLGQPLPQAQAIVVLTAGRLHRALEYHGSDQPDRLSLERLRYTAHLHHRTGLPVLVSGGQLEAEDQGSLAALGARVLREEWGVRPVWKEGRSLSTWENARYSATLLAERGIQRVFLVTHAWHMPRAVYAFRRAGMEPIPAPTAFVTPAEGEWRDFLPRSYAQRHSYWALHELLGLWWYHLRDDSPTTGVTMRPSPP